MILGVNEHDLIKLEESEPDQKAPAQPLTSYSDLQINFVVERYKEYAGQRRRVRIHAFSKELRGLWQRQQWLTPAPSRQTIAQMLAGNGLRSPEQVGKKQRYHEPVKKFFPNAQLCLDGKEIDIAINDKAFTFIVEMAKDLASDNITAAEFGKSETAELVQNAYEQHRQKFGDPMSALVDNSSANNKATIDLGAEGVLIIKAHPYRGETKGQLEGEFGRFERLTSPISIYGFDDQARALSIAKETVKLYALLRNQTPRCRQCPFTPEELIRYKAGELKIESAYDFLKSRQDEKRKKQETRLRIDAERQTLLESVAKEQRLKGDLLIFKKSFSAVESSTIREAECAFAVLAGKDQFDESKRTMAYFNGIARNIQAKKDQQRKDEMARRRYGLDNQARKKRDEIKAARLDYKRKQLYEKQPWLAVVESLKGEINLPDDFKRFSLFRRNIDHTLQQMQAKSKKSLSTIADKTEHAIMGLTDYSLQQRFEMAKIFKERLANLSN